jgi:hypothetical protein
MPCGAGVAARCSTVAEPVAQTPLYHAPVALDDTGALGEVLPGVVGRGPGVTPAGDDALVGILAILKSPCSGLAGDIAAERLAKMIPPLLSTTTAISAGLNRNAAGRLRDGWPDY